MSDLLPQTENPQNHGPEYVPVDARRSRRIRRGLGILLLSLSLLLAWYLAVFYLGWQSGQSDLMEKRETEFVQQIERQIDLANEDISKGSFALALRRLEWVLERAPNEAEAQSLYQQAQGHLDTLLTPPAAITPSPAATPIPSPTPPAEPIDDPESELYRLRQLVTDESWDEAVPALVSFQWQHPNYQRNETDQLLYEAYIALGLKLLEGDQVELGLSYLEQAEKLGDLPAEVMDYRLWAELYLQGIAFFNVNWGATTYYFRDLCLAAPFYQSSCQRLQEALIAYGDQYASGLDWCPAESLYQEANQHGQSQLLSTKLAEAREACLTATPTPTATVPSSAPITSTLPLSDTYTVPMPFVPMPAQ